MKDRFINIGIFVLATIAFAITVSVLESINPFSTPMPKGMTLDHPDFASYMASQSVAAYGWIILGYATGSLVAGFVLSRFNNSNFSPFSLGGGLTGVGILNLYSLPHPTWFWISIFVYIPFIYLGTKIYPKRQLK